MSANLGLDWTCHALGAASADVGKVWRIWGRLRPIPGDSGHTLAKSWGRSRPTSSDVFRCRASSTDLGQIQSQSGAFELRDLNVRRSRFEMLGRGKAGQHFGRRQLRVVYRPENADPSRSTSPLLWLIHGRLRMCARQVACVPRACGGASEGSVLPLSDFGGERMGGPRRGHETDTWTNSGRPIQCE